MAGKDNKLGYYEEKEGSLRVVRVIIIMLALFVIFLLILFSLFILDISGNPRKVSTTINELPELTNSSFGEVLQFYPNMKFNHNNISYIIDNNCDLEKEKNIMDAFDFLSSKVMSIKFYPVLSNEPEESADIAVSCGADEKYNPSEKKDFFIAGEGGAKEIIPTGRYYVINGGIILLYGDPVRSIKCDWPNTEIHELIHVFGFNHSGDKNSLMYSYLESCEQKLDESIIRELKNLYSKPNLPDLYFENITASKRGRYLDFNITIRNSGVVDADNVSFSVIENGELVETKELKDIKFGAGIVLEIGNLKLLKRDSKEIKIFIDYFNKIEEIDKENNIAALKFE